MHHGFVEIHRPDGIPDIVQQVEHGVLLLLGQLDNLGCIADFVQVQTLRQYTHLGDASTETDGLIYDPALKPGQVEGNRSGNLDDRLVFYAKARPRNELNAAGALALASVVLKDYNRELSVKCLSHAKANWDKYAAAAEAVADKDSGDFIPGGTAGSNARGAVWGAAIDLYNATGEQVYKDAIYRMAPEMLKSEEFFRHGYLVCTVLDKLNDSAFKDKVRKAVAAFKPDYDKMLAESPYEAPQTFGMWGGSEHVAGMGARMYMVHKSFPELVDTSYTLRAAYYNLGVHPFDNISWIAAVGLKTTLHSYQNNRSDNTMIPGAPVPGYVLIRPDFPESSDSFPFYWFESEATIGSAAAWVLEGLCAQACVEELTGHKKEFAVAKDVPQPQLNPFVEKAPARPGL
jgi:hypothetical protein